MHEYICPITGLAECNDRRCELHYMDALVEIEDPVFTCDFHGIQRESIHYNSEYECQNLKRWEPDAPIELSARDCEKENAMRWQQELTLLD